MSREIAQTVGGKKFGLILALIAAFAIIATFGYQHAGATFLTDQSLTGASSQSYSIDTNAIDLTHPSNAVPTAMFGIWSTDTTVNTTPASYALSRVTRYVDVGVLGKFQVSTGYDSVFESPVSASSAVTTKSANLALVSSSYVSTAQSGLINGADVTGNTSSMTPTSSHSWYALSGQNSFTQNGVLLLCVLLSVLVAVFVWMSITLKPAYTFGPESSTPIHGKGWIFKRFGAPMRRSFAFIHGHPQSSNKST